MFIWIKVWIYGQFFTAPNIGTFYTKYCRSPEGDTEVALAEFALS